VSSNKQHSATQWSFLFNIGKQKGCTDPLYHTVSFASLVTEGTVNYTYYVVCSWYNWKSRHFDVQWIHFARRIIHWLALLKFIFTSLWEVPGCGKSCMSDRSTRSRPIYVMHDSLPKFQISHDHVHTQVHILKKLHFKQCYY